MLHFIDLSVFQLLVRAVPSILVPAVRNFVGTAATLEFAAHAGSVVSPSAETTEPDAT